MPEAMTDTMPGINDMIIGVFDDIWPRSGSKWEKFYADKELRGTRNLFLRTSMRWQTPDQMQYAWLVTLRRVWGEYGILFGYNLR